MGNSLDTKQSHKEQWG